MKKGERPSLNGGQANKNGVALPFVHKDSLQVSQLGKQCKYVKVHDDYKRENKSFVMVIHKKNNMARVGKWAPKWSHMSRLP